MQCSAVLTTPGNNSDDILHYFPPELIPFFDILTSKTRLTVSLKLEMHLSDGRLEIRFLQDVCLMPAAST